MSRREPASSMQWEAYRFPSRRAAPPPVLPEAAPEPADWRTFRFPTCEDEARLRRHGLLQEAEATDDTDGSEGQGDAGSGSGSGSPPALAPADRTQVPSPASGDWEYDASGVRLVNCRLAKTMALARIDTPQKLARILAAAGQGSSLASALDKASLDVHGIHAADLLRATLPASAPLSWSTPPCYRGRLRR